MTNAAEQKLSPEFERYLLRAARRYWRAHVDFKEGAGFSEEVKQTRAVLLARARDFAEVAEREGLPEDE